MNRVRNILAAASLGLLVSSLLAQEKSPLNFEVKLPAGATLEINGHRTTSAGESRLFQTPPVVPGKTYTYTLKATLGDRQVTRAILLKPGTPTVIDLRPDFAPPATKPPVMQKPTDPPVKPEPPTKPVEKPRVRKGPPREGFVTFIAQDGESERLWVFKPGSKELSAFEKEGEPVRYVTLISAGPPALVIRAPNGEVLDAYLKSGK